MGKGRVRSVKTVRTRRERLREGGDQQGLYNVVYSSPMDGRSKAGMIVVPLRYLMQEDRGRRSGRGPLLKLLIGNARQVVVILVVFLVTFRHGFSAVLYGEERVGGSDVSSRERREYTQRLTKKRKQTNNNTEDLSLIHI